MFWPVYSEFATQYTDYLQVIRGLTHRRALTLAPEEWYQLLGPTPADSLAQVLKVAIDVPAILEQAEQLIKQTYIDSLANHYMTILIHKFNEVQKWRAQTTSPYWVVPSVLDNPADDDYDGKLFPFALQFSSVKKSIEWIFSSTIMLQTLDTALNLADLCPASRRSPAMRSVLARQNDADKLARILCQCFEYCYTPENGTFAAQATCSTRWVVRRYFQRRGQEREVQWCSSIGAMRGSSCFRLELMTIGIDE